VVSTRRCHGELLLLLLLLLLLVVVVVMLLIEDLPSNYDDSQTVR